MAARLRDGFGVRLYSTDDAISRHACEPADPSHAVWLVTSPARRRAAFTSRPVGQLFWRRTSDPAAALEFLLERDALFDEQARREGADLGLTVVQADGSASEAELTDEVARLLSL